VKDIVLWDKTARWQSTSLAGDLLVEPSEFLAQEGGRELRGIPSIRLEKSARDSSPYLKGRRAACLMTSSL